MRSIGRSGDFMACVVVLVAITQLAGLAATRSMPLFPRVDPHGAFLWASVHHAVQLLMTLLAAWLLGFSLRDIGFNLNERRQSLAMLRSFLGYFVAFVVAGHVILFFLASAPEWGRPLDLRNVGGELAFKALLSGTAEEPLFRGLVMMLLWRSWKGEARWLGIRISHAGLLATGLFIAAHIGFTLFPLRLTFFSPIQLVQAAILGFFYAVVFDRTRSLLTPILAHNFANVFLTGVGMLWATFG